jgi:hypothetical protein
MSTTLQLCTDESEILAPEKVQFTCVFTVTGNDGGRTQSTELPTALLLSIENNVGVPLFTLREIKLLRIGDSFMTEPLEFLQGYYKITDFMLVDDSAKVLYATPRNGSTLAKAVVRPLPYGFNVTKNKIINVEMEVIEVSQRLPEEFGYASFGINAVNPLQLSVFTTTGTTTNLTTANAYILKGTDTLKSFTLAATVNLISFKGDVADTYTLVVVKEGYNTYSKEFVYSDLIAMLGTLPLKVYLIPATFTMLALVDNELYIPNYFLVRVSGNAGTILVNWGDGSSNTYSLVPTVGTELEHIYPTAGNFLITVSGDLEEITTFYSFYGPGRMDAINLQGLTQLQNISFGLTYGPKVIDFTYNTSLESIFMPNLQQLERLILPVDGVIKNLNINGPNQLSTASVDEIINALHESVVLRNAVGGTFDLTATWYPETDAMVGPPSAVAKIKLRELRDTYQWSVVPDPL